MGISKWSKGIVRKLKNTFFIIKVLYVDGNEIKLDNCGFLLKGLRLEEPIDRLVYNYGKEDDEKGTNGVSYPRKWAKIVGCTENAKIHLLSLNEDGDKGILITNKDFDLKIGKT